MQSETAPVSKTLLWTGRIMSALPVLLTLLGAVMKLVKVPPQWRAWLAPGFPRNSW